MTFVLNVIILKQKLLTIVKCNKCSFIFQQSRPIEFLQHNSFKIDSSTMFSKVVCFGVNVWRQETFSF